MTTYRPTDEMLADFAFGAARPGMALLVASHLAHSSESRQRVATFEGMGGALLADEPAIEMGPDALDRILAQIDAGDPAVPAPAPRASGPLPGPVMSALGVPFDAIPWKRRLPGVAEHVLAGFDDERVSLLRARPGSSVPQHTHDAQELTLVLHGALSDAGVVYRRGDVAINDQDDDHQPKVVGDEICYCLIVQQGAVRFTGTFSRVLNYLGE